MAFCHNRALQDLYPDSYRLLFTIGSFTSTTSSSHVIIKSPHFIYIIYLYMINIVLSYEYIYIYKYMYHTYAIFYNQYHNHYQYIYT